MYNFSIFIDDAVAGDLEGKIDICSRLMINNMEIDDILDGMDIADFNGEQTENCRRLLIANNKKIVLLCCSKPVSEMEYYKKIFRKAHLLGVENIKITVCKDTECNEAFIADLKRVCEIGAVYGIGVLLENRATSFLSTDKEMSSVYGKVKGRNTGIIFNPLEFTRLKSHPFFHVFYYSRLKNDIMFLRVNDGLFLNGSPALPARGNSEIKELASILLARGFKGYFSFVPYFDEMSFSKYAEILDLFKKLLIEM